MHLYSRLACALAVAQTSLELHTVAVKKYITPNAAVFVLHFDRSEEHGQGFRHGGAMAVVPDP